MPVELWFPVPFLIHDVEAAVRDATRAKVMAYLETEGAKRDVSLAPVESVETSYYVQKQSVLEDAKLDELKEILLGTGKSFIEGLGLAPIPLEVERAWLNVFRPGAQEAQHSHDASLLSASYYVEAPEGCGDLVFPDPVGARRSHRAFTNTTGKTFFTMPDVAFKPQAGRLVMFESWMPHSVQCNKSDKVRISLAFNLRRSA
jgi:uncharacterized protein (TIGR02466 family)